MHGQRVDITPEILLKAYAAGVFPMAESAEDDGLFWVEPQLRGVLPLDGIHVSRRLARTVRSNLFEISSDRDFDAVIAGCAEPSDEREKTWINTRIRRLYGALFDQGHCHTVEVRREGRLVGGLYGIALGRAFFGESMFHRERDASKVALIHLAARLRRGGFRLLDTQFVTGHLEQFGAVELPRADYKAALADALRGSAEWKSWDRDAEPDGAAILAALAAA